jgi:hypothetical protein
MKFSGLPHERKRNVMISRFTPDDKHKPAEFCLPCLQATGRPTEDKVKLRDARGMADDAREQQIGFIDFAPRESPARHAPGWQAAARHRHRNRTTHGRWH